jgi:hypothetical protein
MLKPIRNLRHLLLQLALSWFAGIMLTGCALVALLQPPTPEVAQKDHLPRKVAVLPFVNKTSNPEAGAIVRKMFYNFFSSLNYLDVEPSIVDAILKEHNLYQKVVVGENVSPRELGRILGVDALVFGEVPTLGKIYALLYAENSAGLSAEMISCYSEKTIWKLEHTVHQREGDVPLSLTGLAATVIKTAINYQQATQMKAASELCMQMIGTIPNPPEVTEAPPKIQALVHNGAGRLLRPGNTLKVVLIGDRGKSASWSAPPLIENLPMAEKEPGVYVGSFEIKPDDRLPYGRVVGYLTSDSGAQSQWVDILGPVTVGEPTRLPQVISQDTVLDSQNSPYIVEDGILVMPDVRFTVEPGTVIWFRGPGFVVKGELQILGTEDDPVRLTGVEASTWKGVFLDHSQRDNKLQHCKISGAEFGFRTFQSSVSIEGCLFQDNVWGIVLEEGQAAIHSTLIRTSRKTGISSRQAHLLVKDSTISENTAGGFLLARSQAQIEQNNISNNGQWALKVLDAQSQIQAANNWWGKDVPEAAQILGSANIQPVLDSPVEFRMID